MTTPRDSCQNEQLRLEQLKTCRPAEAESCMWEPAKLYRRTGRQAQALECVERITAGTDIPERQAGYGLAAGRSDPGLCV